MSQDVHWSRRGVPPCSLTTVKKKQRYLLQSTRYLTVEGDSHGASSIDSCRIGTVNSNLLFVLLKVSSHRALIFLLSSQKDNSSPKLNQCVFIKGFRAKRGFPWFKRIRAAAEPLPDDPDDSHEDEMQVTGIPDTPEVSYLPW